MIVDFARGLLVALALVMSGSAARANEIQFLEVEVETRILDIDPFSGMKSRHTAKLFVHQQRRTFRVEEAYATGTTDFFGVSLPSIRNNFRVRDFTANWQGDTVTIAFGMKGETATGVGVVPNINYNLSFNFRYDDDTDHFTISVGGCHDGDPAYRVRVKDLGEEVEKTIYHFKHKSVRLLNLFGECDQTASGSWTY